MTLLSGTPRAKSVEGRYLYSDSDNQFCLCVSHERLSHLFRDEGQKVSCLYLVLDEYGSKGPRSTTHNVVLLFLVLPEWVLLARYLW